MSIFDTRRENFQLLVEKHGGQTSLAKASGKASAYVSQLTTGVRNLGEASSRSFEQALGLPKGWLDVPQTAGNTNAPFPVEAWECLPPQARTLVLTVVEFFRASGTAASSEEENELLAFFRACTPEARRVVLAVAQAQSATMKHKSRNKAQEQ